ncbi:hypothetical protein ACFLSQ_05140 [Bacteroidota bacterium]
MNKNIYRSAVLIFIISRVFFSYLGVEFDINPLYWFHQYLDYELLKNNLIESIYYLHSQPPLFNLYLGMIVKFFSGYEKLIFQIVYSLCGLAIYLTMIKLMLKLNINKILSFAFSTLFIISPAAVLYERWLFYTFPVALLVLLSAYLFYQFIETKKLSKGIAFFSVLAMIVLTRSLFHIAWFFLILAVMLLKQREYRKIIIKAAIIPAIIVMAVLIKNLILFGTLSSSWNGMSLAKVTMKYMHEERMAELVKDSKLDSIVLIPPFLHVKHYKDFVEIKQFTGIKCLDDEYKSSGHPNYNNINYIEISNKFLSESWKVINIDHSGLIKSLKASCYLYFRSPTDYKYFHNDNRDKIDNYDRLFNKYIYGQQDVYTPLSDGEKEEIKLGENAYMNLLNYTGRLSVIFSLLLIIFIFYLLTNINSKKLYFDRAQKAVLVYIIFNIFYVMIIANIFETGENNRFRFLIEPLHYILFAFLINFIFIRVFKKKV